MTRAWPAVIELAVFGLGLSVDCKGMATFQSLGPQTPRYVKMQRMGLRRRAPDIKTPYQE